MLRKKKDNSEYEIDRELTWKFAIEKNVEYQDRISELEEENKKLNIKVASLEWEIKWLNYTIEKLKEENQYREDIADVIPEWEGHIAEETIQDLQARIKELNEDIKKIEESQEYRYHRCMKAERGWEDED